MKIAAMKLAAVAAGGALGASLRYMAAALTHAVMGEDFPYGTLMVNVVGSLVAGFLWGMLGGVSTESRTHALFFIGLLGAFTTFSTFSIETLNLVEGGQIARAVVNTVVSVVLCIGAAAFGVLLARQV